MSDEIKRQVLEMSVGIGVHALILLIGAAIWFREIPVFLGILVGAAAACLLLYSMAYSTEMCMEFADEDFAKKKMVSHSIIRNLAVFAGLAVILNFTDINLIAVVLGLLGLKTGAYLYSFVHKKLDHKAEDRKA